MTDVKQPTLDEVKATITEDYGLDAETQGDLIDSIADKHFSSLAEQQKELSKAIDKKAEYRDQLVDAGLIDSKTFKPVVKKKPDGKKDEIDYGQKTFINKILGVDLGNEKEMDLVDDYVSSGKSLDDLISNKHFKNDLKDLKEAKRIKNAIPTNNKRSVGTNNKAVDYWADKPFDEVPKDLKRDVLNAKIKEESSNKMF